MAPRKAQHNFVPHFQCLCGNQGRAILRKVAAKHTSDVKQRAAPADQTSVVRTVTDDITFRAQYCVLRERSRLDIASFRGMHPHTNRSSQNLGRLA